MMNERLNELLAYLQTLSQVQASGHYVNDEIKEVIKEIRTELGLLQAKERSVQDSKRLIFKRLVGERQNYEPTFLQNALFDAVFTYKEKEPSFLVRPQEEREVDVAVIVLEEMKVPATFKFVQSEFNVNSLVVSKS